MKNIITNILSTIGLCLIGTAWVIKFGFDYTDVLLLVGICLWTIVWKLK